MMIICTKLNISILKASVLKPDVAMNVKEML